MIKPKAQFSLPKIRIHKHDKEETHENQHHDHHNHHHGHRIHKHEKDETHENQPHDHHGHHNALLILVKMKHKLHPRPKKDTDRAARPKKTLAHSDSKLREVFSRFDLDRDGWVDPWDLGSLIRALGGSPTQAELDRITTREKLYGSMDFNLFVSLVGKYFVNGSDPNKEVQQALGALDTDSDGYVSVSDLKLLLTTSGEKLESAEFDQWIQEVVVRPDGKVRYEDVIKAL